MSNKTGITGSSHPNSITLIGKSHKVKIKTYPVIEVFEPGSVKSSVVLMFSNACQKSVAGLGSVKSVGVQICC